MARCGCSAVETCNCSVQAGNGVSVTGSGTPGNPYVVAIDTIDCAQVRPCISAGKGAAYNSTSGIVSARLSPAAGNQIEFAPDGGLYVDTDCATVRGCLTEGNGIDYDPLTGVIAARPSTDPGNALTFGGDGGLYAPALPSVTTGCGLAGDGSVGSPLSVAVADWPYNCDLEDNASLVYCDDTGTLRGDPRSLATFTQTVLDQQYPSTAVPTVADVLVESRPFTMNNPDPCRDAFVVLELELDVDFTLPPGAGAMASIAGDDMVYIQNTGSSTQTAVHAQGTKLFNRVIPAGGSLSVPFQVNMGRGSGGATYDRIQTAERAFIFVL